MTDEEKQQARADTMLACQEAIMEVFQRYGLDDDPVVIASTLGSVTGFMALACEGRSDAFLAAFSAVLKGTMDGSLMEPEAS